MRRGRQVTWLLLHCLLTFVGSSISITCAQGESFPLPLDPKDSIVGEFRYTQSEADDTLLDIARWFDLGLEQLQKANPTTDTWIPGRGTRIFLPHRYILPNTPREGIVLNVAELRLYYYPPDESVVMTFPVSIGRMDWKTPLGKTKIVSKEKNPSWYPPDSIRREHEEEGEFLPQVVPGGAPENPLGLYALRLAIKGYLIHGTDERKAFGIGLQVTHGCIRMYPDDIEALFQRTKVGTPVYIVDQSIKIGRDKDKIYLEVHRPIDPEEQILFPPLEEVFQQVKNSTKYISSLDEQAIGRVYDVGDGIPMVVGEVYGKF